MQSTTILATLFLSGLALAAPVDLELAGRAPFILRGQTTKGMKELSVTPKTCLSVAEYSTVTVNMHNQCKLYTADGCSGTAFGSDDIFSPQRNWHRELRMHSSSASEADNNGFRSEFLLVMTTNEPLKDWPVALTISRSLRSQMVIYSWLAWRQSISKEEEMGFNIEQLAMSLVSPKGLDNDIEYSLYTYIAGLTFEFRLSEIRHETDYTAASKVALVSRPGLCGFNLDDQPPRIPCSRLLLVQIVRRSYQERYDDAHAALAGYSMENSRILFCSKTLSTPIFTNPSIESGQRNSLKLVGFCLVALAKKERAGQRKDSGFRLARFSSLSVSALAAVAEAGDKKRGREGPQRVRVSLHLDYRFRRRKTNAPPLIPLPNWAHGLVQPLPNPLEILCGTNLTNRKTADDAKTRISRFITVVWPFSESNKRRRNSSGLSCLNLYKGLKLTLLEALKRLAMNGSQLALDQLFSLIYETDNVFWDVVPVAIHLLATTKAPRSHNEPIDIHRLGTCLHIIVRASPEAPDSRGYITDVAQIEYFSKQWPVIWRWTSLLIDRCILAFSYELTFEDAGDITTTVAHLFYIFTKGLLTEMMSTKGFVRSISRLWLCYRSPDEAPEALFETVRVLLAEAYNTEQAHYVRNFVCAISDSDPDIATILLNRVDDGVIQQSLSQLCTNLEVIICIAGELPSLHDKLLAKQLVPLLVRTMKSITSHQKTSQRPAKGAHRCLVVSLQCLRASLYTATRKWLVPALKSRLLREIIRCEPFFNEDSDDEPYGLREMCEMIVTQFIGPYMFYPQVQRLVDKCLNSFQDRSYLSRVTTSYKPLGEALTWLVQASDHQRETMKKLPVICGNVRCKKRGAELTLRRCGSCRRILYCSVACQKISWLYGHKSLCFDFKENPIHPYQPGRAMSLLHHTILYFTAMSDLEHYIPRNLHRLAVQRRSLPDNVAMSYNIDYRVFPPTIRCEHATTTEIVQQLERFSHIGEHNCNITVLAPWGSDGPGQICFWGPGSDLYYSYDYTLEIYDDLQAGLRLGRSHLNPSCHALWPRFSVVVCQRVAIAIVTMRDSRSNNDMKDLPSFSSSWKALDPGSTANQRPTCFDISHLDAAQRCCRQKRELKLPSCCIECFSEYLSDDFFFRLSWVASFSSSISSIDSSVSHLSPLFTGELMEIPEIMQLIRFGAATIARTNEDRRSAEFPNGWDDLFQAFDHSKYSSIIGGKWNLFCQER
ncbi:hypothetical protein C8J56DRAFT_901750 [Mycena floridula]|nr:hypothetical protein C8J56DRAFT_901750 [Mycena floridula]